MALTKLNLAQGVTGTLPTSNYVGGKIGQIVSTSTDTQVSNTDASYTMMSLAITPSASTSNVFIHDFNVRYCIKSKWWI